MKKFGKVLATTSLLALTVGLTSCAGGEEATTAEDDKTLLIWSFTDELQVQGDLEYFKENYTGEGQKWEGYDVNLTIIPTADYLQKILPVLQSGKGAPDIFTGELDMVQNFMEAGYIADLEALINADEEVSMDIVNEDFVNYIVQSGKDENGVLRALSWQTTPGGVMFRTDIAKEVWGDEMTADSVDMTNTEAISAWVGENKFNSLSQLETSSMEVKEAGNYRLFIDDQSIRHYASGDEPKAWVVDGALNPEKIEDHINFMETSKAFYGETFQESLTANAVEWSGDWFIAINQPIQPVGVQEQYEVMAYSLPTWGLFHVLEPNMQVKDEDENVIDEGTFGNWGIAPGPNPYYWGGTYLVINEDNSDMKKELAFDFMKTMLFDEERMTERAIALGDVYSRKSIMDKVQEGFEGRESLNGQNHYEFFMTEADKIDLSYITKYNRALDTMSNSYTQQYAKGELTLEEALNGFYDQVATAYGQDFISSDLPYKN